MVREKGEYDPDLDICADMPLDAFMNHSLIMVGEYIASGDRLSISLFLSFFFSFSSRTMIKKIWVRKQYVHESV